MKLTIKPSPFNKRVHVLARQLPARVRAIIKHFPDGVAADFRESVAGNAPQGIKGYPKMLQVREVTSVKGIDSVVGVVVPGYHHSQRLRQVDAQHTVLYVRPKQRREPDPLASLLAEYNPWTMDTLPHEPEREVASVVSRKVTEREARLIARRRTQDVRNEVRRKMRELGIHPSRHHPVLLKRRVTRDIAFEVLRREFGVGDKPHHAHLRPALRQARKSTKRHLKEKMRWLSVPSELRWDNPVQRKQMRPGVVRRVRRFQDIVVGDSPTQVRRVV